MRKACQLGLAVITAGAGIACLAARAPSVGLVLLTGALLVGRLRFGDQIGPEQVRALDEALRAARRSTAEGVSVAGLVSPRVAVLAYASERRMTLRQLFADEIDLQRFRSLRVALRHQPRKDRSSTYRDH
jgi:hypothetical protein